MTTALPPSRGIGIAGTTLAHGLVIALAILAANRAGGKMPLVYEVNLVAAPLPVAGPAKSVTSAPPAPKAVAPVIKPKPSKTVPAKVPVRAKPADPVPTARNPVTPLPGVAPSTGQDVVTVHQDGVKFLYPEYLSKIENEILKRWDQSGFRAGLHASIAFVIMQDGTVADASITVDKSSGSSLFNDRARAAIESASALHAFGPLPSGFNSASLPILFNFTMIPKGGP